jgi:hypothetical protein
LIRPFVLVFALRRPAARDGIIMYFRREVLSVLLDTTSQRQEKEARRIEYPKLVRFSPK